MLNSPRQQRIRKQVMHGRLATVGSWAGALLLAALYVIVSALERQDALLGL